MKKSYYFYVPTLPLLGLLAAFTFGCQKQGQGTSEGSSPAPQSSAAQPSPQFVSVEKNSFNEVTSQLDPGGDLYLYLGTAQWLDGLSSKMSALQDQFTSMPDLKPEDLQNIDAAFNLITNLVRDSGVEDISGVGLSSVEIEKGMYRNKALLHHYDGKGTGFLWQFFGRQPHPLTGLDFLPDDTALAYFSDADLPLVWTVLQRDVSQSNIPQAQQWLQELPGEFEKDTDMKWDAFLHSLGGEFGLVLTLDASNNVIVPVPSAGNLQIPNPGLMLVFKVNDDTLFNRIDQALTNNPQVESVNKPGFKMRTMPVPLPLPIQLRPSAASSGGYLFIASSDTMIQDALAVKNGQKNGLKSTDEFKHLSQNVPDQGNQFVFVSRRFAETMYDIQKQVATNSTDSQSPQTQWMQSLFQKRVSFAWSVGANTSDGYLVVGNSSQSYASAMLLPAVAVPGILAAIAIPNFEKARTTSQQNACINNLRQIQAAKNEWALEKSKAQTDVPAWDDLQPYLAARVPLVCPAGGTYSLNAVSEPPTCSIPGHELP
jgi:hypothetical protein